METISDFHGKNMFLSNFFTYSFTFEGREYLNAEAAFQAAKCVDDKEKDKYTTMPPNVAKRTGRREKLRPDWEEVCTDVMYRVVKAKFSDPFLCCLLKKTGDAELVEGNHWHDNKWGDCHCPKCKDRPGENRLGKILMRVRSELPDDVRIL